MDSKKIRHLYNRIGFGITPTEIESSSNLSREKVVYRIFEESQNYSPLRIDLSAYNKLEMADFKDKIKRREIVKNSRKDQELYNKKWIERLCKPKEILREKMTLFWANHFVASDNYIVFNQQYNNLLRKSALGNFGEFTKAISKAPAMLKYLNGNKNVKEQPNENFGRELLELFTLGAGNYTERDIKEGARAFTGYNFNFKGGFRFVKKKHDFASKIFLGNTGNFSGDDIIDNILNQKQCARFICNKIYKYFVNDEIDEFNVEKMVTIFYKNYQIDELLKYVFMADWFYDDKNIGAKIKSPVELLVSIHKIVPYTITNHKQSLFIQRSLGQLLLKPPNVAGWKGGRNWVDPSALVFRLQLPSALLSSTEISYSENSEFEDKIDKVLRRKIANKKIKTTVNWNSFKENYQDIKKENLAESLFPHPVSKPNRLSKMTKEAYCIRLMSLPEFQLC